METYLIFLRGVNVSGKNIIKMADLKEKLSKSYSDVRTYIQSGNIVLETDETRAALQSSVRRLIKHAFGHDVDVFVFQPRSLEVVLNGNPFSSDLPGNKTFVTFLDGDPRAEHIKAFKEINLAPEEYVLDGRTLYFHLPESMANAKLTTNFIEKKLQVRATGRNLNTLQKMLSLVKK
ncbi:DUF1697 domain-containing protein [Sphingobacterium lactis]|uniref:DUF1697 domain-containing protein n=1 Tax=Sphingobacterium lactis TaxID=797291 RepID=UPI003DA29864